MVAATDITDHYAIILQMMDDIFVVSNTVQTFIYRRNSKNMKNHLEHSDWIHQYFSTRSDVTVNKLRGIETKGLGNFNKKANRTP